MQLLLYYKHLYMSYEHKVRGRFLPDMKKMKGLMKDLMGGSTSSATSAVSGRDDGDSSVKVKDADSKDLKTSFFAKNNVKPTTRDSRSSGSTTTSESESVPNKKKNNNKGPGRLFP